MKRSSSQKSQPSISRFFQPKISKSNDKSTIEKPASSPKINTKLSKFSHNDKPNETLPKTISPDASEDCSKSEIMQVELINHKDEESDSSTPPTKRAKSTNLNKGTSKKPTKAKLTPLESQFISLKLNHRDKLLAVQVGYKFKFFADDAAIASKILNIMLLPGTTKFEDLKNGKFAYCSIPDNRLHIHLQRLLNYGYKVAVIKQTESAAIKNMESSNKSGLFERKITGVYTKATYMGDEINTGDPNFYVKNSGDDGQLGDYILCLDELNAPQQISIVAVQPLTGDIIHDTFRDNITRDELETRFAYITPSEILVINNQSSISKETLKCIKSLNKGTMNIMHVKCPSDLEEEFVKSFEKITTDDNDLIQLSQYYQVNFSASVLSCVCELIKYLEQFKLANVFTITSNVNNFVNSRKFMLLPSHTLQALEIFRNETDPSSEQGTLAWLLNHTRTKMGQRLLKKWISMPLINIDAINSRLDAIDDLTSDFNHLIDALKNQLNSIGKAGSDLEKLLIKVHYSSTYNMERITRKDLYLMLKCFDEVFRMIKNFGEKPLLELKASVKSELLKGIFEELDDLSKDGNLTKFLKLINPSEALNDRNVTDQKIGFFHLGQDPMTDDISKELEEISKVEQDLNTELQEIRKFLKRPNLSYVTNLKESHLIEVRNGKQVDSLPKDWIKISGTKSVSRFRNPTIIELHKRLQYHNELLLKNCDIAFNKFLGMIDNHYRFFNQAVKQLSIFDCLLSFTASSLMNSNYVRPKILPDEQKIEIKKSRNPIIENLPHSYSNYVANDINISYLKERVIIITGPNMGGKSSYVKQVALLTIMCQIGCFIPCESAEVGIFDSIFIRMGASDNILKGKSTFMIEMLELANIISNFTDKSLIILDEIGRGTGTNDGIAIAYSILKYLIEDPKKPLTLFITHYPSLHTLENDYPQVVGNYHMNFMEKGVKNEKEWPEIVFLYTLVKGVVSNLYGLNVAKLAGIPTDVIQQAYEVSERLKSIVEMGNINRFSLEFCKLIQMIKKNEVDENYMTDKLIELSRLNKL